MVIPKIPISLEKNPDTDVSFFIHNDIHNERHIIDTSESFAFPLIFFDTNLPSRESEMFLTVTGDESPFSLSRASLIFFDPISYSESEYEDESFFIHTPRYEFHIPILPSPQPSRYSFGLSIFDCFIKGSFDTPKNPPKVAKKKDIENIRNQMISLYHEFRVFYLRYSPLLNFKNEYHSEHKKLSRCCPSHFWQVLE